MKENVMNEKEMQFLLIVQTMFIANAINIRPDDINGENRAEYSATSAFMFMDDAVQASKKIPEKKSASEAAREYGFYFLNKTDTECPNWCMKY